MEHFIDKCCNECWHSAEKPCEQFVSCSTEGPLCHTNPECEKKIKDLNNRLTFKVQEKPIIIIGKGTCGLAAGAEKTEQAIRAELQKLNIDADIQTTGCVGFCAREPIVDIKLPGKERVSYCEVTPKIVPKLIQKTLVDKEVYKENLLGKYTDNTKENGYDVIDINKTDFFKNQMKIVLQNCGVIDPTSIDTYISYGGFKALDKVLRLLKPEEVVKDAIASGLRGRGGGGFPTGKKWEFAMKQKADQKYIVCNADEGDPGAFMDRSVLESDPFRVVEGMIIGGYAIGASIGYIYCRAEYPLAIERLINAISKCREYGLLGKNILGSGFDFDLKIKKGAGAFVCGEETALLASIEGKRGMPRPRPPYPAVSGLFGKPTVINNVETFANVAQIFNKGADWFASIGTETSKGTKVFALSGKIKNTGLVEIPMGIPLKQVVFDIGGGIKNNKKFKAVQIGGPSGGCLPMEVMDTPVDYESLKKVGAMMGSGGFVVMDEDTCIVDVARFFLTFIQNESCGKCVPCREGTKRMLEIIERIPQSYKDTKNKIEQLQRFKGIIHLQRLADVIKDTSLCGLGQSAPNPVLSGLRYFKDEYEAHLYERTCPAKVCKELLVYDINNELCTGCGVCARKCPTGAILGEKNKAHYINNDKCIMCGMCFDSCRFDAVNVN